MNVIRQSPTFLVKKYTERLILTAVKETKTQDEIRKAKKCMKQKIARYFGLQNKPSSGATKVALSCIFRY